MFLSLLLLEKIYSELDLKSYFLLSFYPFFTNVLIYACGYFFRLQDQYVSEQVNDPNGPLIMNAFEMITLSQGLNLSALFDRRQVKP